MTPGISTHVFLPQRLSPALLEALARTGARTIEIFAARQHFDYTDRAAVREIAAWFRSNDVAATLHQPLTSDPHWTRHSEQSVHLLSKEKSLRIAAMDEVKRALESAETLPISACVLHLGAKHEEWSEQALDNSLTAIEHLKAFAAPLGVTILLENLENDVTSPGHLLDILRIGHFDRVGICFDVGHAHLGKLGVESTFHLLKTRIMQCHLHDNHGPGISFTGKDEHLWPGTVEADGIDWNSVYPLLATLHPETQGIFEIQFEEEEAPETVTAKAIAAFDAQRRILEAGA